MSRIQACMDGLREAQRKALVPFITAGDPGLETTTAIMHTLVSNGADIIELGIPFSDPMADGPVIQKADERALENGCTIHHVLQMVTEFRRTNDHTPVVLMGYLNPVEAFGYEAFAQSAGEAGVDGMITVDLPPESGGALFEQFERAEIDQVLLIAPTTKDNRIKHICDKASGYLYYVSLKGVTGSADLDVASVAQKLDTIRQFSSLPIMVGFGIKDAVTAAKVGAVADGVVVGSALVSLIETHQTNQPEMMEAIASFTRELRQGLDNT